MGQYHVIANLDKKEFLYPHEMGDGLKLMEFGSGGTGGVANALVVLLSCSNGRGGGDFSAYPSSPEAEALIKQVAGRWAGDRIAVVGDYAEPHDLSEDDHAGWIYVLCVPQSRVKERYVRPHLYNWILKHYLSPEQHADFKRECSVEDVYLDITPLVCSAFSAAEGIKYSGDGWRSRDYEDGTPVGSGEMRPDMVIAVTQGRE